MKKLISNGAQELAIDEDKIICVERNSNYLGDEVKVTLLYGEVLIEKSISVDTEAKAVALYSQLHQNIH